jgi:hypothetical protein
METIASSDRSTSSSVVAHDETLMRMTVRFFHTLPPHHDVPSRRMASTTRVVNEDRQLTPEQIRALDSILWSTNFITLFRGAAGTGKSFVLKRVQQPTRLTPSMTHMPLVFSSPACRVPWSAGRWSSRYTPAAGSAHLRRNLRD